MKIAEKMWYRLKVKELKVTRKGPRTERLKPFQIQLFKARDTVTQPLNQDTVIHSRAETTSSEIDSVRVLPLA